MDGLILIYITMKYNEICITRYQLITENREIYSNTMRKIYNIDLVLNNSNFEKNKSFLLGWSTDVVRE